MRKCTICRKPATQGNAINAWCSDDCALAMIKRVQAKQAKRAEQAERQATRIKRESLKPRRKLMAEAQAAFNTFIRTRDAGLPCISCGRNDNDLHHDSRGGMWDAGHYRSVGSSPELRFDPANCHRQCKQCNRDKSGNHANYRTHLIARIGIGEVNRIEGPSKPQKYTADDLRELKARYRAMTRALLRRAA